MYALYLGDHGGGRAEAQHLLHHLSGVPHFIQHLACDWCIQVWPELPLLLTHLTQQTDQLQARDTTQSMIENALDLWVTSHLTVALQQGWEWIEYAGQGEGRAGQGDGRAGQGEGRAAAV